MILPWTRTAPSLRRAGLMIYQRLSTSRSSRLLVLALHGQVGSRSQMGLKHYSRSKTTRPPKGRQAKSLSPLFFIQTPPAMILTIKPPDAAVPSSIFGPKWHRRNGRTCPGPLQCGSTDCIWPSDRCGTGIPF